MTDPLSRNAGMRLAAKQVELDTIMAQVADAITNLNKVAATASSAINNSALDRANIHTQMNALAATVAALPTQASLDSLSTRVAKLEARTLTTHATSNIVPTLALGGTATVTITWPTPFPDANYQCSEPVLSSSLVGKVTGTITNQTATGCTVKLTTTIAVSVGSTVTVVATRYA